MTVSRRIKLVPVSNLTSSYRKKNNPDQRWNVSVFKEGSNIAPDMLSSLLELEKLVKHHKGNFYIIDLYRSWKVQATARKKFETGEKSDYVSKPGKSFHNAGRAVDISVKELEFEGQDRDDWLSTLWDLAKPLGFKPIIKIPDIDASEAWHMDYPGNDWSDAYKVLRYSEVAKCCTLDVGGWNPQEDEEKVRRMFIQSQLIRFGLYEIGAVDGIFGSKTLKVLKKCGVSGLSAERMAVTLARR